MSAWHTQLVAARAADDPQALMTQIPYASFMGISLGLVEGELRATMRYSDHLVGDSGIPALHGGALGALLESAAILTVLWNSEREALPKTINLTVQYLRSGRAEDTFAEAEIVRAGRRVAAVRAVAWQSRRDKPIATADAHFLLG